jgi:acetamidase/formamidase
MHIFHGQKRGRHFGGHIDIKGLVAGWPRYRPLHVGGALEAPVLVK